MKSAGDNITTNRGSWTFSGDVARKFDGHVEKSVPMYNEGQKIICDISDYFVGNNATIYELGCSTGTLLLKLAQHNINKESVKYIGVDLEEGMVDVAIQKLNDTKGLGPNSSVDFQVNNIVEMELAQSDLIICYYTIQFVSPCVRQIIIDKIYNSLKWGGALLMFEKVRASDARFQDILSSVYNDFKLSMGYSPDEIIAKSMSLRGVMEPFSTNGNIEMLKRAGFIDIESVFKHICFEGFLAIK